MPKNETATVRENPTENLATTIMTPPDVAKVVREKPAGFDAFRALSDPSMPEKERLSRRIAALMVVHLLATGTMLEAMTSTEVRQTVELFRRQNPHAWHAALSGDYLRFTHVMKSARNFAEYQRGVSDMMSYEG
jgi:hypothetical protein